MTPSNPARLLREEAIVLIGALREKRGEQDWPASVIERLLAQLGDYEDCITWDTSCSNCAHLLDRSYSEFMRAEDLALVIERAS